MKNRQKHITINWLRANGFMRACLILVLVLNGVFLSQAAAAIETHFLYQLSNFQGPVSSTWARIHVDEKKNEIYVINQRETDIRIFNDLGMEVYRFGDDGSLGGVLDLVVEEKGNILVLSRGRYNVSIIVCDFRGEPISELKLKNLPEDFSGFSPTRMAFWNNRLYLLDSNALMLVVTDTEGVFLNAYDLLALIGLEEKKRDQVEVVGFSIDAHGNVLFSLPVLFKVFKLFPDGTITSFGEPGGAPGKFNLAGGVVADDRDNYFVADWLKSVVQVFDKDFTFQTQFGYRGTSQDNLVAPKYLALDSQGRLYVSQVNNRGISVFKIDYE